MKVELLKEAADSVEHMGAITARNAEEVVSDALRTYLWILYEQTSGRAIVSVNGSPNEETELERFVEDEKAAKKYFQAIGW